ncbi:hypothetical protein SJI00_08440 [Pseudomonas sp. RP23018S]|uniref:hypothetical protein n=1 Tax=Pseudomonas sp. RP23018S TaxID=3096037 RepID=UPI002ACA738C|nr:hypothetical protein [Pseudomonas sp. RP23018S]MDZ5602800.1 hypothetical protein [Pseudomonas sp. RP23018S]
MTQPRETLHFFYQGDQLSSLVQPGANRAILRSQGMPLAEVSLTDEGPASQLLATDLQQSVLGTADRLR